MPEFHLFATDTVLFGKAASTDLNREKMQTAACIPDIRGII
jgi:hypothetical protein